MPVGEWRHAWLVALVWATSTLSVLGQVRGLWTPPNSMGEPLQFTAEWLLSMDELQSGMADASAWPAWTDTTSAGLKFSLPPPLTPLQHPWHLDKTSCFEKRGR